MRPASILDRSRMSLINASRWRRAPTTRSSPGQLVQDISRKNQKFVKDFAGGAGIVRLVERPAAQAVAQLGKIGVSDKTAGFPIIGGIDPCCQIHPR